MRSPGQALRAYPKTSSGLKKKEIKSFWERRCFWAHRQVPMHKRYSHGYSPLPTLFITAYIFSLAWCSPAALVCFQPPQVLQLPATKQSPTPRSVLVHVMCFLGITFEQIPTFEKKLISYVSTRNTLPPNCHRTSRCR